MDHPSPAAPPAVPGESGSGAAQGVGVGLVPFLSFGGIFGISFLSRPWILCFLLVLLTDIKAGLVETARLCHSCLALIPSERADPRKSPSRELPRALPHPSSLIPPLPLPPRPHTAPGGVGVVPWPCSAASLSSLGCARISGVLWNLFADRGVGNLSRRFWDCSVGRGEAWGDPIEG